MLIPDNSKIPIDLKRIDIHKTIWLTLEDKDREKLKFFDHFNIIFYNVGTETFVIFL